jgi:plastocyanin
MSSTTRGIALGAIAATMLVPAAVAQGATRTVTAGPPGKVAGTPPDGDSNAFYRKTVTVHIGDKVKWKFNGFHTVTVPAKGKKPPAFISPDPTGTKVAGVNDAAGAPFWFNGQTRLLLDSLGAFPVKGKSYDGKKLASSGVFFGNGQAPPYTLKFTKKGSYAYYCTIHGGMKGTVKVLGKGKAIPSVKANAKAAKKEYAKVAKRQIKDAKFAGPPGNEVWLGNDTVESSIFRFFPATKPVPVGTTVTFSMPAKTSEIHTVSFGPADYLQTVADAFVAPDPANPSGPPNVFSAQVGFPSDVPTLPAYDGTSHGNGFLSTGVLDREAGTPSPPSAQVTFSKAGTYSYICLIHPFMKGQIVVG